jgi:hypothetical protein
MLRRSSVGNIPAAEIVVEALHAVTPSSSHKRHSESDPGSLTFPDNSLELYYALCAFEASLHSLIPTALSAQKRFAPDWATQVLVTAHDSDFEDVQLLAKKCGVADYVSCSTDASMCPSSCFSPVFSIPDINVSDESRYWWAEREVARVMALIENGSQCELMRVESGSFSKLCNERASGCGVVVSGPHGEIDIRKPETLRSPVGVKKLASSPALSSNHFTPPVKHSLPELWVGVPPAAQVRMLRMAALLRDLLPGVAIHVFVLKEETLIKHLPPGEGLGRLRVYEDTVMVADSAGHPTASVFRVAATSATGVAYTKFASVVDSALRSAPSPIAAGGSRSCSMGALVQIGEGAASTVIFMGSGHNLELHHIGVVLEDTTLDPEEAARDSVTLMPLSCVNPGCCIATPSPHGRFINSLRAEPGASPSQPEVLRDMEDCLRIVVDIALYSLPSGPDDPPHGAGDVQPLSHLSCALPVRGVGRTMHPITCLPPFTAYSGIVLVTGANVSLGPGPRKLNVIGYAVKSLDVPDPSETLRAGTLQTKVVKVVTYFAAPAGGIAPYERDSGGGVYQLALDGSPVLHSFVSARAILTEPVTGDEHEFYTLTPAHLALEQVIALQDAPGSALPPGAPKFVLPR